MLTSICARNSSLSEYEKCANKVEKQEQKCFLGNPNEMNVSLFYPVQWMLFQFGWQMFSDSTLKFQLDHISIYYIVLQPLCR